MDDCKRWKAKQEVDPDAPMFEKWVNYIRMLKDMMLNFCNKAMTRSIFKSWRKRSTSYICATEMKSNIMGHISLRITKPSLPSSHSVVISYAIVIGERYKNSNYIYY